MSCGGSIAGGGIVGGFRNITGLSDFTKGAEDAVRQTGIGAEQLRKYTERAVSGLDPYATTGTEALDLYKDIVLGGDMSSFRESPGYEFRLGEGVEALERGAAARGGLLSGAQQKALTQFGQDIGGEDYYNYLDSVGNLMSQGLGAASTQGGYLTGAGGQLGGMYSQLGQTAAQMRAMRGQQKLELIKTGSEAAGSVVGMSDKKVKENIEYTGEKTSDNIPIVTFNYKKEFEKLGLDSNKKYKGVIAQDVEKVKPEAVVEEDGIKKVIYSMIGMKMEEI